MASLSININNLKSYPEENSQDNLIYRERPVILVKAVEELSSAKKTHFMLLGGQSQPVGTHYKKASFSSK